MEYGPYGVSAPPPQNYNSAPPGFPWHRHSGSCPLLTGYCSSTRYTYIDGGPTMFYAPFVGCIGDKQECCPFMPRTTTGSGGALQTAYPQPKNSKSAVVSSCPLDYYSISGSCCPSDYTPWTTLLGGETPCVSTITGGTTTPLATGIVNAAAATKPTVTVTGTVFAMQYALADTRGEGALASGTVAGIAAGSIFGVATVVGLSIMMWRHYRDARRLTKLKMKLHDDFYGNEMGTSEVPTFKGVPVKGSAALAMTPCSLPPAYTPVDPSSKNWWRDGRTPRVELPQECLYELPAGPDMQVARPQRLSRGYPRVVYTPGPGSSASSSSERMDKELDPAASHRISFPSSTKQRMSKYAASMNF